MQKRVFTGVTAIVLAAAVTLTGCGRVKSGDVLATLDGEEITVGAANFMAQTRAALLDANMIQYYGEEMWSSDLSGEGQTMEEEYKGYLLEEIQELYLLDAHKSDYNVELTDDELNRIKNAAENFVDTNSSKAKRYLGATEETVSEYLRLLTVQSHMTSAIGEEIDTTVPDEVAVQKKFSYIFISNDYEPSADEETEALEAAEEESTDAEADADAESGEVDYARELAELVSVLVSGETFEEIAEQYEDIEVSVGTYGAADLSEEDNTTSFDLAVLEAADALEVGAVDEDVVITDGGYYFLRLDSNYDAEATEAKRQSVLDERKSDHYQEVVQGYIDGSDWQLNEATWSKVSFDDLYTVVTAETE